MKIISDDSDVMVVVTSSKKKSHLNGCGKIDKLQIFGAFFFNRSMQGRDSSCRLDTTIKFFSADIPIYSYI